MCKKEIFIILLSISIFIAFIVPIRAYEVLPPMSTDIFVEYVLKTYVLMVAGCIFSFACFWVVRRIWAVLDKNGFEAWVRLSALRFSYWRRSKNISFIAPRLQCFLFLVLKRNNEFLHLPLGGDVTTLSPLGTGTVFRDSCIFYQFQLILTPDYDTEEQTLLELLRAYIVAELRNFGIAGLNAVYVDNKTGTWFTVYLDRAVIDQDSRLLTFELLYVSDRASARYLKRAVERDREKTIPEPGVYDDEL